MSDAVLVKLDSAQHALAECKTAMEAKQISDIAEAARVYLERTNASVETVNRATEVRILAERQMGTFLKEMPKAKGGAGHHAPDSPKAPKNPITIERGEKVMTIPEMGLTYFQAERAQKLADIPEPEFKERIAVAKIDGRLSTAKVLNPDMPAKPVDAASWADEYAMMAIDQLKKILRKDPTRAAALRRVRDWIDAELGE